VPIPESQLLTWSRQGAITTSKQTHESIRSALAAFRWRAGVKYEVYLQGSYKNDTNIFSESDVDVLVEFTTAVRYGSTRLSEPEQARFNLRAQNSPRVSYWEFREMVCDALGSRFGSSSVRESRSGKAFQVTTPYRPADVVVCQTFKDYLTYPVVGFGYPTCVQGVSLYAPTERRWIENFPRQHHLKGVAKNTRTAGRFKRSVRLFKNLRNDMVEHGRTSEDLVCSYFIECLLYNCNDSCFRASLRETVDRIVMELVQAYVSGKWTAFRCLTEQLPLFGELPEQWSVENAIQFWTALVRHCEAWRA
jgi:predicted nucleotidyltransferase